MIILFFLLYFSQDLKSERLIPNDGTFGNFNDNSLSRLSAHVAETKRFWDTLVVHEETYVVILSFDFVGYFAFDPLEGHSLFERGLMERLVFAIHHENEESFFTGILGLDLLVGSESAFVI